MKRTHLLGTGLLFLALSPFAAWGTVLVDDALKPSDHEALGKVLASYAVAKREDKGVDKARADVGAELEKIRKRLKNRDPLALTADLGKAMWQSFTYDSGKIVTKGKVKDVAYKDKDREQALDVTYALWAPPNYDPRKAYPLILCIPQKGEKPSDHLTEKWISQEARANAVLAAVQMPEAVSQWGEVGNTGKWGGAAHLLTVFREVSRTYATDFDRVYVAGRGEGVAAALAMAARNPDRFAGVIGRSGDPGDLPCENFRNLPTFFAGAGAGATAFSEKCTKAGYDNCTLKPEGTEQDVWAWLQDHPRIPNPAQVVLLPGTPNPYKAYWLEIPPWDGQGTALIKAAIDRATNTISVDGEGVGSVILYFNDILVDLDKPVKVVCNGSEHVDVIPRNLPTTLDLFIKTRSDPGKLYTATHKYDLPAKPKPK
jgi:hypothetical protein